MKRFCCFGAALLLFSCNSMTRQVPNDGDQMTARTEKNLKEEKNLVLIETDEQSMTRSFNYYEEANLEKAQELIAYAVNEYLSDINSDEKAEDPWTAKDVKVVIFVKGPDRSGLSPEKIHRITLCDNIVRYYNRSDRDHPICQEVYGEALSEIAYRQGSQPTYNAMVDDVVVAEATATDGAKASISTSSFKYSIFRLKGEGFKPCESLNIISTSCHEVLYFEIVTDKNGNLPHAGLMPEVLGQPGGMCHIDILRNDEAPIRLKFPWGQEVLRSCAVN